MRIMLAEPTPNEQLLFLFILSGQGPPGHDSESTDDRPRLRAPSAHNLFRTPESAGREYDWNVFCICGIPIPKGFGDTDTQAHERLVSRIYESLRL